MITKEDAYHVALNNIEGKINHCRETEKYWIFQDIDAPPAFGGCTQPVAVSKETGKPLFNYILCLIHHMIEDSDVIREYEISENLVFKEIEITTSSDEE